MDANAVSPQTGDVPAAPFLSRGVRSIALFSPNSSSFYFNLLLGLRKALVRRGIDVHVGWGYLDPLQLAQFCDGFRPDVVIEIDRTRGRAEGLAKTVRHVAWLQDWRSMTITTMGRSNESLECDDWYLFVTRPEAIGIDRAGLSNWGCLAVGTDPEVFAPEERSPVSDLSLMGYIPAAEHQSVAGQSLRVNFLGTGSDYVSARMGTVEDLVTAMKAAGLDWNTYDIAKAHAFMNNYVRDRFNPYVSVVTRVFSGFARNGIDFNPHSGCLINDQQLYDIENQLMRLRARKAVAEAMLSVSRSVRLFGVGFWQTYKQFSPFFQGPLRTEADVRDVFLTSRVNLHNAMSQVHARVLDCMATSSFILLNKIQDNGPDSPESLHCTMEPGIHFLEYDEETLEDLCREALADHDRRRRMAKEARKVILARHCWSHRVADLLDFLNGKAAPGRTRPRLSP